MSALFSFGDMVGDMQIVKRLSVMQNAALYQAKRDEDDVLVKVAHDGFHERLKREVNVLKALSPADAGAFLRPKPAHHNIPDSNYGKVINHERVKYYAVFEYLEGESLEDYLLKTPLPWYQHTGWIMSDIAKAIDVIHRSGILHLTLSPASVLVRLDAQGNPRVTLLDLGMASGPRDAASAWTSNQVSPTYIAPEMVGRTPKPSHASDVHSVGLILYEMLTGRAAYHGFGRTNSEIWQAIEKGKFAPINRDDLASWPQITEQAISTRPEQRPKAVLTLHEELAKSLPSMPSEKADTPFDSSRNMRLMIGAIGVALLLATVIAIFFT
ncbi:MAG: serine/threonine protein kinase [Candidatus Promineifilaceae bacterium]